MKDNILDSLEHCPVCGRYYTDDDAICDCKPESSESDFPPNQYEAENDSH